MLLSADILKPWFDVAQPFDTFVTGADLANQSTWNERFQRLELDGTQHALVDSFQRRMRIICLTGRWCGDCALQGAALARIAQAAGDRIDLRFLERSDDTAALVVACMINAGTRVPVTWFMAEDGAPVARFGDRTLSRYRSVARKTLGDSANVLAEPSNDPVREVLQEVLDEVERVQWLLRFSPRLRAMHQD